MLFNSFEFAVFLGVVLALYVLSKHRQQNLLLLVSSYVFYGWWDWRFLSLILLSTIVDYFIGLRVHASTDDRIRKRLVACSVGFNLGLLGIFKYYDFFVESFVSALALAGIDIQPGLLEVILPVGISFYTFQTISYSIDIYRREVTPTRNFFDFALFVSFFPQLVAGPIERAKNLLPQLVNERKVEKSDFEVGGYLIFWGLFKKVVIADNLALIVDPAFADPGGLTAFEALIALYAFSWQIYCDFSGYTDIARGVARLFGVRLMLNFNLPYFALSPGQFWRRWHISLSSWLRDYLYLPLGGNRRGSMRTSVNLAIVMLLGGLWHGAALNFVLWGAYQGLLLILFRPFESTFTKLADRYTPGRWLCNILFFHLVCFGWLIFRCESLDGLVAYLNAFLNPGDGLSEIDWRIWLILPILMIQVLQFWKRDHFILSKLPLLVRVSIYFGIYCLIFGVGQWGSNEFIYFQF
jgi:D-alanyl-lipoteichoic acid acyltransferase DltB (MBOAT superfamily)